ncbi:MAG: hypothetical protein ACKVOL_15245 [Novosphingobium sp.]
MSDLKSRLRSYAPSSATGSTVPALLVAVLAAGALVQLVLPAGDGVPAEGDPIRAPRWDLPVIGEPGALPPGVVPWIFTPARIGAPPAAASADGEAEGGDAAAAEPPKPRFGPLSGAWVIGSMRTRGGRAVIIRPSHGIPVRLPMGGSWRGWTLTAIEETAARFRHGGKTYRINFGTAPAGGSDASDSENTSE